VFRAQEQNPLARILFAPGSLKAAASRPRRAAFASSRSRVLG
jgi:hypothetical protein